jgi:hypothetical protein
MNNLFSKRQQQQVHINGELKGDTYTIGYTERDVCKTWWVTVWGVAFMITIYDAEEDGEIGYFVYYGIDLLKNTIFAKVGKTK